jgi:teichuronic acid biosynthesis glycosyltransferase TuaH
MIVENTTIVILGAAKFDGPYESTSFTTAKYLAQNNEVLYADYPYTWKDYLKGKETSAVTTRKDGFRLAKYSLLSTGIPRLKILILPLMLSINFLPEGRRIKAILDVRQIVDFIFINSFNFHYPNVGRKLKPTLNVYHCVDPLVIEHDKKHGLKSERQIVKDADLVFCTSKQLYDEKIIINKNTYFIPNAADLRHSTKALDPDLKIHESIAQIPGPVIGYFGNIERRIDFRLLKQVVELNQDKSFVFVGPVDEAYIPTDFTALKNVYFIGRLPYEDMPAVLKGFDVCMIPFKKDEFSSTIFPLKLFEYLGAAKPVVATNFNMDLEDFTEDVIPYCSSASEFSSAISDLLLQNDDMYKSKRLQIAERNTWDIRLKQFSEILASFYYKRKQLPS